MAMTPEGRVKKAIKATLNSYEDMYYHMPVQNGMGAPTLDFVGCHRGRFFAIEAKAPGKKPTPRQELTMRLMRRGGAKVFTIDTEDLHCDLEHWLDDSQGDTEPRSSGIAVITDPDTPRGAHRGRADYSASDAGNESPSQSWGVGTVPCSLALQMARIRNTV